ncbi:MAG: TRAP transporter small permease [Candidatus Cyclobacteriaceae bacterium M3_2C_046]
MRFRRLIDLVLSRFLIIILAIMTISVLWQVASRYILRDPSSWTDELVRFLFMWVGLLGAAYITGLRMHLAIDILPSKSTPQNQKRLNTIIYSLVALFALLTMVVGGFRLVYITLTLNQISPTLEVPLGYVYLVVPISGIFIVYYSIMNIINYEMPHREEKLTEAVD